MRNTIKIAARNLRRYRRRTLLTSSLITLGVVAVLLFISVSGSFKSMMIAQITDSMLGHLQIHQKGYLASIDTLPLNRNMKEGQVKKVTEILEEHPAIAAYSPRIRLGAMFSNYTETTNIRLNAVIPEREMETVPLLRERVIDGGGEGLVRQGEILVPELIAKGMNVKVGDGIVLVATNDDGSVNGQPFTVGGIVEGVTGPGGRDGYIHLDDARTLLRLEEKEISEIAVRIKDLDKLDSTYAAINDTLAPMINQAGKPAFEAHTWESLSPFFNIAKMIDLMTMSIKVMLVAIVLVSIMNVMIMAVYERINEIGTIAAMGTVPTRILALFLTEGFLLGILGAAIGIVVSLAAIAVLRAAELTFNFGQQQGLVLIPFIKTGDVISIALIVIGIAVLGSLQPAWKAARMDPITALRHV
ncbi:ABC transporter permease [Desulfoprunum benzoelyticum]|uniref:Putative ABC transport system permease protein n=1 Tax=Desulfoprunum benzoelyticum TaxID=1506996 RepID=A0A840UYU8_9BACT|nr:ABC transporter permease [Desulfoprunum benzoelyticum]MBB5346680.1 putative ABC transport system permease protein [Desulfoprunum benzoelyticum]MBM9529075.1 ABC transporter permease [Desulfoprunum benzoelyticum]